MSFIPCTQACQFQKDGLCTLEQTAHSNAQAQPNDLCLDFTPRSNQGRHSFTNVRNPNQSQTFRDK